MGTLIQVRDVPEDVHRTLKARAAHSGVSLSEYVRAELARVAASPTPDELVSRLLSRRPVRTSQSSAQALRSMRNDTA